MLGTALNVSRRKKETFIQFFFVHSKFVNIVFDMIIVKHRYDFFKIIFHKRAYTKLH